jgi:uncharacterized protein with GYD domain
VTKGRTPVATYVSLIKMTAEGAKNVKTSGESIQQAGDWIGRNGGKVVAAYALQGSYDFLWITEFPEESGAWKSLVATALQGRVSTETLTAIPIERFLEYVAQV